MYTQQYIELEKETNKVEHTRRVQKCGCFTAIVGNVIIVGIIYPSNVYIFVFRLEANKSRQWASKL